MTPVARAPFSFSPFFRISAALLLASAITYSCVERPGEEETTDPKVRSTLESTATCVMTQVEEFKGAADALKDATEAWAEDPEDVERKGAAQEAWSEAMLIWHRLEVMQIGPAGSSGSVEQGGTIGGQDLRDLIYSWPVINSCRIDQALESKAYEDDLKDEPVNAQGLDAIEYLAFYDDGASTCLATTAIIADGRWDGIDDLPERRAAYAMAAAELVSEHAGALLNAWDEEGGDFYSALVSAGKSGPFESQAAALNAVIHGIFYIEIVVKDQKLAIPLALRDDCANASCPEDIEHQFSGLSKDAIAQNLAGFELIFHGCGDSALGLEGLLDELGADLTAEEVQAAIDGIKEALSTIEEDDLVTALAEDPASVNDLYDAIKVLTDLLKGDLVEVLEVNVPSSVGGDND
jgi:predicted lipoprotein